MDHQYLKRLFCVSLPPLWLMTAERKAFSLNSEMFSRPIYTVFNDTSSFPRFVKHLMLPTATETTPGLEIARSLPRLASGCVLQCGLLFNQIRNLARFCCFSGVCAAFRTGGCCMPVHYLTRARHTLLLGALQSCWVPQFSVWQRSAIIYICLLLITSPGAEIYQPDLERICA